MKRTLSVKEVAQELGASVQSIRRALARSYSIASATCCGSIWIVPGRFLGQRIVNDRTTTRRAIGGTAADAHSSIAPVR